MSKNKGKQDIHLQIKVWIREKEIHWDIKYISWLKKPIVLYIKISPDFTMYECINMKISLTAVES